MTPRVVGGVIVPAPPVLGLPPHVEPSYVPGLGPEPHVEPAYVPGLVPALHVEPSYVPGLGPAPPGTYVPRQEEHRYTENRVLTPSVYRNRGTPREFGVQTGMNAGQFIVLIKYNLIKNMTKCEF